ncbi:MAG: alpha/beta hydrolase [Pirellulaceae bacterium]
MHEPLQTRFARIMTGVSVGVLAVLIWGAWGQPVQSQVKKEGWPGKKSQPPAARKTEPRTKQAKPQRKKPAAEQEDVTLTTDDGVELHCTYYPGPETKQTVPMMLVHDWDGSRKDLDPVALWMQRSLKLSVIVPDLRGHGESRRARGISGAIDRSELKANAINKMVLDIEACKSFLLRRNNEGKVNIEQLGVLGTGMGSLLAMKWAVRDWSVPDLPTYKQGRDVKALILISPTRSFRGATVKRELGAQFLRIWRHIATLTVVGSEELEERREAKRVHKIFKRAWGERNEEGAPFFAAPSSLQGTELLMDTSTGIDRWIATFIDRRLARLGQRFPWQDRTSPLE